jgi:hypothetical protein
MVGVALRWCSIRRRSISSLADRGEERSVDGASLTAIGAFEHAAVGWFDYAEGPRQDCRRQPERGDCARHIAGTPICIDCRQRPLPSQISWPRSGITDAAQ